MKDIADFPEKITADAYCDELRAKGINAEVEIFFIPRIADRIIVKVPEEQYELYKKLFPEDIKQDPVDDEPIVKCPYCESSDVAEPDSIWLALLQLICVFLIVPMIIQLVRKKQEGTPYKCNDCKRSFRFKL